MQFLKSVLFGSEGNYNILGVPVQFQNNPPSYWEDFSLEGANFISQVANKCINSNLFRCTTQGYTHVLIHEMSHALTRKLLTQETFKVTVITSLCTGITAPIRSPRPSPNWKNTIVSLAGPMGNIAFASCKLIAASALKDYLSWPVALILGSGAVIWISGELLYAYISASRSDLGDFGLIRQSGNTHLALASTALIAECALGIFAAVKLAS